MSKLSDLVEPCQDVNKDMEFWSEDEKKNCKDLYNCEIIVENGSYDEVYTKEAPNDSYVVSYTVNNKICFDLTRGPRLRIFDMYWDKFRDNLKKIDFGNGRKNSKLWGHKKPEKKKRK